MAAINWTDLSYDGKELRKLMKRLYGNIHRETQAKKPNWDKITLKLEAASRISLRHAKLVEIADQSPRLKNMEKIIENIPPHILQETKARMGI